MHYLTPIIPQAFRDQIVAELTKLYIRHDGTALGAAIKELSIFVHNYAARTPAKLAMYYALSGFEQEAVRLLTSIYLAILEMRGFNVINMPKAQLEYLNQIFLKMLRKIPGILADYKTFCKAHSKDYTEIGAKPALDNQLIDAYFKQFENSLKTSKDPFLHELIGVLVTHKLLTRTTEDYAIDNIRFLFLLMVLKLQTIVNVSEFFSAIIKNRPDTGQFAIGINELITQTWPTTLEDIKKAVTPITIMAYQLTLNGDASVLKDVIDAFGKCTIEVDEHISACFNLHNKKSINSEHYFIVDSEKTAKILNSILDVRNEELRKYLLKLLQTKVTNYLKEDQKNTLEIDSFLDDLPKYLKESKHSHETSIFINLLRSACKPPAVLSFVDEVSVKRHKSNQEFCHSPGLM